MGIRLWGVLLFTICIGARDLQLATWKIRHPHPTALAKALAHDGQKFVLVDGYGYIFTSISGYNWTIQHQAPAALNSVAYGNTNFIAVGTNGMILSSPDATNWTILPSPVANELTKVAFAGNQFLIVGSAGTILSSTNGRDFAVHDSNVSSNLYNIVISPAATLAVGPQTVLVSTNAGEWKQAFVTTTNWFQGAAYLNGKFHNGWYGTTNPMVWTNKINTTGFSNIIAVAATTNGFLRAINRTIHRSQDGVSWSPINVVPSLFSLTTISNRFQAVGNSSIYFDEGFSFAVQLKPMSSHFYRHPDVSFFQMIAADTNGYLAIDASRRAFISQNGEYWRPKTDADPEINLYDYGFSTAPFARATNVPPFFGFGSATTQISDDGVVWQNLSTPTRTRAVAALGDVIAASDGYRLSVSTNRSTWTTIATNVGPLVYIANEGGGTDIGYSYWISSIHAGHGLIVASTLWGELIWTTNGFDWKTNRTRFQYIDDFAFTPRGVAIVSGRLIAEADFEGIPPPPLQPSFTIRTNQIHFEGSLRLRQIQGAADLETWTAIQTTSTNAVLPISTNGQQFFRAVQPD
jgi:hypothetical protein